MKNLDPCVVQQEELHQEQVFLFHQSKNTSSIGYSTQWVHNLSEFSLLFNCAFMRFFYNFHAHEYFVHKSFWNGWCIRAWVSTGTKGAWHPWNFWTVMSGTPGFWQFYYIMLCFTLKLWGFTSDRHPLFLIPNSSPDSVFIFLWIVLLSFWVPAVSQYFAVRNSVFCLTKTITGKIQICCMVRIYTKSFFHQAMFKANGWVGKQIFCWCSVLLMLT